MRDFADQPGARGLEELARFLLRSEANASSRIEGLQVSPQQVALAELAESEGIGKGRFSRSASLVANNIVTLRRASKELASVPAVTVGNVEGLQRALLPDERYQGLRGVQNWIGGSSSYHPLDAEFVPPPADQVERLMVDLVEYSNGGAHAPLVQAALVHAQFETIHPFIDGNGRVGRALIHTVLARRGLLRTAVLPVSLVLLTRLQDYVRGLTAYRYSGSPSSIAADEGTAIWIGVFFEAVEMAVTQARRFVQELEDLRRAWTEAHTAYRRSRDLRERPRADSAVVGLLQRLPELPVVTTGTVQRVLGVSFKAARDAAEELAGAGVLRRKQIDRGTTGYLAPDIFDLLTITERRLASTRWDTRNSSPRRMVPALPR